MSFNTMEDSMNKRPIVVSTLEEAASEGYRQGFEEGYAAAREVVASVVGAWRKEPGRYDLEGALHALDLSRDKAKEMLGTPIFTASPVPSATALNGKYQ